MISSMCIRPLGAFILVTCVFCWLLPSQAAAQYEDNYILKPSDLLRVEVFQEPDLLKEIRVAADGSIVLPLIGKVNVGDRTVQEAQNLIRDRYERDYLINPQINLLVLEYSESYVQVLGQVNRPGLVKIRPDKGLTLIEAIAGANGFTRLARTGSVRLKRKNNNGLTTVTQINVNEILKDSSKADIPLQEGDIIFIDEKVF